LVYRYSVFETRTQTPVDTAETVVECHLFDVITLGVMLIPNFDDFKTISHKRHEFSNLDLRQGRCMLLFYTHLSDPTRTRSRGVGRDATRAMSMSIMTDHDEETADISGLIASSDHTFSSLITQLSYRQKLINLTKLLNSSINLRFS